MKVDCDYIGYEVSWEDSLLDVINSFIHMVTQHAVNGFQFFDICEIFRTI